MPVYRLGNDIVFPEPGLARSDGLLAVGGDLRPERLLLAYCNGIFPWYNEGGPILWWSPDPRFVLYPETLHISKSMKKVLRQGMYRITYDTAFREVITQCGETRKDAGSCSSMAAGESGTWITPEMLEAYCKLHELGFAHSAEAWYDCRLAGGLYGVSFGSCFFGESMFSTMDNASKAAFLTLVPKLAQRGFSLIDCQVHTSHLESLGAIHIPRREFLNHLAMGLQKPTLRGNWSALDRC